MAEEPEAMAPARGERKKGGFLKYIIIIIIILAALWYFAPDVFDNMAGFVQNLISP